MKTITTLLLLGIFTIGANAQFVSETFEAAGAIASWTQFANDGDAPENMVIAENPDKLGINHSDSCLMFTVLPTADAWVGAWAELGDIDFAENDRLLYMMVYKSKTSRVGLKVENGADVFSVYGENTLTDEWEVMEFDFAEAPLDLYVRLVFFPDFPEDGRTEGTTCYIDNIAWEDMTWVSIKRVNNTFISIFPNPATEMIQVQYPGMKSITISNIVGQTVKTVVSESNFIVKVPVSDLKAGVYFVTLDTEDGLVSSKFVKE